MPLLLSLFLFLVAKATGVNSTEVIYNEGNLSPKPGIDNQNSHQSTTIGPSNLSIMWETFIEYGGTAHKAIPVLSNDGATVYLPMYSPRSLSAFSAQDGKALWNYSLPYSISSSVVHSDDTIFIVCGDDVTALNPDGTLKWYTYVSGSGGVSNTMTPTLSSDEKTLYYGSWSDNVYALDTADGSQKWIYKAGGSLWSSVALSHADSKECSEIVYIISGMNDQYLYAIDAATGALWWKTYLITEGMDPTYNQPVAEVPMVGADGVVYVKTYGTKKEGGMGGRLIALSGCSGEILWDIDTRAGTMTPTIVREANIIVVSNSYDGLFAYSLTGDHEVVWSIADGSNFKESVVVDAAGVLYAVLYAGQLLRISATSGTILSSLDTPDTEFDDSSLLGPAVLGKDGTLFIANRNGLLYALK